MLYIITKSSGKNSLTLMLAQCAHTWTAINPTIINLEWAF